MSTIEKLINQLRRIPPEASKSDVFKVLSHYGFEETNIDGSHYIFYHEKLLGHPDFLEGRLTIPVKKGKLVKGIYIKNMLKAITFIEQKGE